MKLSSYLEPNKSQLSILKTADSLGITTKPRNGKSITCCPFHKDDSPSFSIVESGDNNEGYYHCFGCKIGGDIFSLVQKMKNWTFPEAKKYVYSLHGFFYEPSDFAKKSKVGESKSLSLSPPAESDKPTKPKIDWKAEAAAFYAFYSDNMIMFFLNEPYVRQNLKWQRLEEHEFARFAIEFLRSRFGETWVTKTRCVEFVYFLKVYSWTVKKNNSFVFSPYLHKDDNIYLSLYKRVLSIDCLNGEIEFIDPEKEIFFSTAQWDINLGENLDDNLNAPIFQAYLQRVQPKEENQILLMELMGYMLVPDNRLQKFFILKGEGKNGKSVFLSILKEMIGDGNYTSLSLDQLEKSYALSALIGKTANICADMGEIDKAAEGLLKSITSGDQITCDRKYLSAVTFLPTAKLVFSTNNIPRFSDKSEGLWRRMIIIPFDEILDDNEIDVTITEKLKTEINEIFLFALEGLKRIIRNGWRFSIPNEIKNVLNEERDNASTLRQFVNEKCTLSPDDNVEIQNFYQEYVKWTRANGQSPSSKNSIGRELARLGVKSKVTTYAGDSVRKYDGINLKG